MLLRSDVMRARGHDLDYRARAVASKRHRPKLAIRFARERANTRGRLLNTSDCLRKARRRRKHASGSSFTPELLAHIVEAHVRHRLTNYEVILGEVRARDLPVPTMETFAMLLGWEATKAIRAAYPWLFAEAW